MGLEDLRPPCGREDVSFGGIDLPQLGDALQSGEGGVDRLAVLLHRGRAGVGCRLGEPLGLLDCLPADVPLCEGEDQTAASLRRGSG